MRARAAVMSGLLALACAPSAADAAICLARNFKSAAGGDKRVTIIVPTTEVARLSTPDFLSVGCDTSPPKLIEYRDNICKAAAFGNDAVQNRFTQVFGVPPARLCAQAKGLVDGTLR